MLPVSVIVLCWNSRQRIGDCLESLLALEPPAAELIVVDNASGDDTVSFVRQSFPGVTVVSLDRNYGYAAGNNAGANVARQKYLAFLNDDTQVDKRWLSALVTAAEADPSVGLVTSQIIYRERPDVLDSAGDGYLRSGGAFKHHHGQSVNDAPATREVFGACGAGFLVRRDLFTSLGGFDEDFFMVYEDVDLSYRARLRGANVQYAVAALVYHAGSASIGWASPRQVFFGQRNLEWTWIKNSPARLLWRSAPSHLLYGIASAIGYARQGQLTTWCRAKLAAVAGLPRMLRKRRQIQRTRTANPERLWALMERNWIAIKRREKRFDFDPSRATKRPSDADDSPRRARSA